MISAQISTYKDFLPLRRKAGTASLHGCKIAVAIGSLRFVASRNAMDGGDIQKPWMNRGKTEIRRFRRLFGYFWAAPKVSQPVESVDNIIGIHLSRIKGEKVLIPNFKLRTQTFNLTVRRYYPMLTDKDLGIKKFILDRIMQINDEIVESDPEYKKLEERPNKC